MTEPPGPEGVNEEGEATAITVFSTVKPWGRAWLPVLFWAARAFPALTKVLRELEFIYFARWTLVRGLPGNGPDAPAVRFRYPHLFFESNFTGTWWEYIVAFAKRLTRGMRIFWSSSFGFPGPLPVEPFMTYIRANETAAAHYYSAYPGATVTQITRALKLARAEGASSAVATAKPRRRRRPS